MVKAKSFNAVYPTAWGITICIVLWGLFAPGNFKTVASGIFNFIIDKFGWMYLLSMAFFVVFAILLACSKFGKIKLGETDSKPEYSYASWFAMLFSAGMGIGLMFYGVAEPLTHFMQPPVGNPQTPEAAALAIRISFFHWGIHPWAAYSILGLALAYFQFRKKAPGLISSVFIPLLGEVRVNGPVGKAIDILAIFATVAGIATSLGLGTLQINGGLSYLFGLPYNAITQVIIILITSVIFISTAVIGIDKGIKKVSDLNLMVAVGLMILAAIVGPTTKIVQVIVSGIGDYLSSIVRDSVHMEPFGDSSWLGGWTLFYWAWWIAWGPFVGTFIARISKGRTIREFVFGVLLVPTLASVLWFAIFGTAGINLEFSGIAVGQEAISDVSTAFFKVFSHYPLGSVLSVTAIFLVFTFFITSANSATFVLGMMSSKGDLNPSSGRKLVWGVTQSLLAVVLLLSGGLKSLQTASIAAAFPFAIIMVLACLSLYKALVEEESTISKEKGSKVA
ncbi:glycine betaine uptake BCCT transporter [Zhaonella formicivorans]|uniref:glycine betaine uptake BCCT transporter n=1 Tax=Zhaonella formicivorans TaxID=2528593 RepID=UPI0010EC8C48|nr:BCCT family transporter [Zhaonella formicivorans]